MKTNNTDQGGGVTTLGEYQGTAIDVRDSDNFVNATAMCQATGKRWGHYWENARAQQFLDSLARNLQCRKSDIVISMVGGDRSGTWVCEEVAMNLAQWCSADFAAWAAIQLTAIRRGRQVAHPEHAEARVVSMENDISVLQSRFEGMVSQMLDIQNQNQKLLAELLPMVKRIDERTQGRREGFSLEVKHRFIGCVSRFYNGDCPCCRMTKIAEHGQRIPHVGEHDHYHHRSMNRPEHGWFVCKTCNNKLKNRKPGGFWFQKGPAFQAFQDLLHNGDGSQMFLPGVVA